MLVPTPITSWQQRKILQKSEDATDNKRELWSELFKKKNGYELLN